MTATLTISGTGNMYNYSSKDAVPWYQYCSDMKYITIGDKVTSIGRNAFYGCTALKIIYYTGSKEEWNKIDLKNDCIPSDAEIIYNATDCDINNGHSLGEWIAEIPATCTEDGVKGHYECPVCHKYFDKDRNEITDLAIPAHHTPELLRKIPLTCTTDGYDTVKCLNCKLIYNINYVPATGHSFGDWTVTKKLTCTTDRVEIRRCGKCDEIETRTTKAKGHKQGELVKHQNATCTKDNGDYYKCLTCGETYFVLGFAKNEHWFLDGECIDCGIAESDVPFDIDLDCAVSAIDLTYLKRILLSNKTAECDPNGDGKLNILDLIALKKRLAKK